MAYVVTTELGTPKSITRIEIVTNGNPAGAGFTVVDVSAHVPKGTKAIEGWFQMTSSAAGDFVGVSEHDANLIIDIVRCQVANVTNDGHFFIRLNSSYEFDYQASDARISAVYFRINIVYI